MSTFSTSRVGMKMGTMMTTIGTHASGQPSTKHSARSDRISRSGGMLQATSVLAMKLGVPSAENTEPRKVEAMSRIITMLAVCAVRKVDSLNTVHVSLP